jgi:threonine synthase
VSVLHISTRGEALAPGFGDVLLAGLARDGGLYVPQTWPALPADRIAGFSGLPYAAVAEAVISPFIAGEIEPEAFRAMLREAYAAFRHPATCPIVQIDDNLFVLELFHGPTLAFKDIAMQLLGRLMDHVLKARGLRATIVGATSGDTGGAAIDAFKGLQRVDIFILYPQGRVSAVQRRQMTTVAAQNVHAIALDGSFDDCQALVKGMFNHHAFRDRLQLSGVNSINWARIVAQAPYYFSAAASLGAPHRPVAFTVPTGNFGDILAGSVARLMGLPMGRLGIATNDNDILARTLAGGTYETTGVVATSSPSMDIQVSSNFERLLFEAYRRDGASIRRLMAELAQSGAFTLDAAPLEMIRRHFWARSVREPEVAAQMRDTYARAGYVLDPHTAVGVAAARRAVADDPATPMVVLGTAHPAKFPDAVERATGHRPALPAHLADLMERREHFSLLPNDQAAVESFIAQRARAAGPGALA